MKQFPEWLNATLASDAAEGQGALPSSIAALQPDTRLVGPARVVLMSQDDNLSVRAALEASPPPGSVLVAAGGSASRAATIGGLLALEMSNLGITGLVTDGLVRDVRELRELRFPVWSRGVMPIAPQRRGPAMVGGTVAIGGVAIHDDDLVIADDDGVVIWPQARIEELLGKAAARLQADRARLAQLRTQN